MRYSITKKKCQEMIRGVCDGCGGELKPIETVDNSGCPTFWAYCKICEKLCWGVEKIVWEIARELVKNYHFIPYSHLEEPNNKKEHKYWLNSQTSGASIIVIHVLNEHKKRIK